MKDKFGDLYFVHIKYTDSFGEDGNFGKKVSVIEEVDKNIGKILELNPDVFVLTADHSTPSASKSHSWHPVPICIVAETARVDACESFGETSFLTGGLGRIRSTDVMPLLLAHAGRLKKYGA